MLWSTRHSSVRKVNDMMTGYGLLDRDSIRFRHLVFMVTPGHAVSYPWRVELFFHCRVTSPKWVHLVLTFQYEWSVSGVWRWRAAEAAFRPRCRMCTYFVRTWLTIYDILILCIDCLLDVPRGHLSRGFLTKLFLFPLVHIEARLTSWTLSITIPIII